MSCSQSLFQTPLQSSAKKRLRCVGPYLLWAYLALWTALEKELSGDGHPACVTDSVRLGGRWWLWRPPQGPYAKVGHWAHSQRRRPVLAANDVPSWEPRGTQGILWVGQIVRQRLHGLVREGPAADYHRKRFRLSPLADRGGQHDYWLPPIWTPEVRFQSRLPIRELSVPPGNRQQCVSSVIVKPCHSLIHFLILCLEISFVGKLVTAHLIVDSHRFWFWIRFSQDRLYVLCCYVDDRAKVCFFSFLFSVVSFSDAHLE